MADLTSLFASFQKSDFWAARSEVSDKGDTVERRGTGWSSYPHDGGGEDGC